MFKRLSVAVVFVAALCAVALAQGREEPAPPPPAPNPPPAPEQPPEDPTEFPKDEPADPADPAEKPADAGALAHRKSKPNRANADRVKAALQWLADHQDPEGNWSATKFPTASTRKEAPSTGNIEFVGKGEKGADFGWEGTTDIGLTGLGMLSFTANGHHHKEGEFSATLRRAILFLRKSQNNDGCFGPKDDDHFVYNHAIATTALAEVYALSADKVLKPILDYAVKFVLTAQNPGMGWRYGVQPAENDTSITGWMVLALHSAKAAGIEVDATKVYEGAFKWFDDVTKKEKTGWRTGYNTPGGNNARLRNAGSYENNRTMDAIHGSVRILAGKTDGAKDKLADFEKAISDKASLPKWEHVKLDYYYWFWGSMFMQQRGGKATTAWWKPTTDALTGGQRGFSKLDKDAKRTTVETLAEHGSWDAVDAWSTAGGRVYATAMGALTLSMPWRFAPATGKGTPEGK